MIILAAFLILAGQLWFLQIIKGKAYRRLSQENEVRLVRLGAPRGEIKDRNGEVFVTNRPSFRITTSYKSSRSNPNWKEIADILDLKDTKPIAISYPQISAVLKEDASWTEIASLTERGISGINIEIGFKRDYLLNEFAAHLIGHTGEINDKELRKLKPLGYIAGERIGKAGIEKTYEKYVRGTAGGEQIIVDAQGHYVRTIARIDPTPGNNLFLTIDKKIQDTCEEIIEDKRGAIVVMDPRNGEVLAMASRPAFNPSIFNQSISKKDWEGLKALKSPFTNRAIQGEYPPGSTFKMVAAAAGLEEGLINTVETLNCNGKYLVGNRIFRCWLKSGHGGLNIKGGIVNSCDIFFYQLGQRVGAERMARYAHKFGLGSPTGIALPGEKKGLIPMPEKGRIGHPINKRWHPGDTVNTSIGQGYVLTTPIQMLNLYCAIANNGLLFKPYIVKEIVSPDGKIVFKNSPKLIRKLNISEGTIKTLRSALTAVVSEGTGRRAKIRGIDVAGKTGTSQNPHGADHASFVCFAPAESPEIAVIVFLENAGHGSSQAAPLAKLIIQKALQKN